MKRRAILSLVALVGCVDVSRPFTRGVGPIVARATITAADAERRRIAALPPIPEELRGQPQVVDVEGPVQHALAGPLRLDLRVAAITTAEDVPAQRIANAMKAERGWVFVTEGGDLYTSATFTGRLRPLRSLGCARPPPPPQPQVPGFENQLGGLMLVQRDTPTFEVFESVGRAAFKTSEREVFWSDGASLHALDVAGAVALAWTSPSRGAVIVGYETLKTTRDGGRTWREVDLGGALPVDVVGTAEGLFVDTSDGRRRIDERDALTPTQSASEHEALLSPTPMPMNHFARGYERVAAPQKPRCAQRAEAPEGWQGPGFVAHLPMREDRYGVQDLALPRGTPAPFGTARGRGFASNEMVPAVVSIVRPDNPSPGHPVTLAWRGEDERGAFTMRVSTTAPREIPVGAPWKVIAVTRAGLLCAIDLRSESDYPMAMGHYWFSAAGARRVTLPFPRDAYVDGVALPDGGVALLARAQLDPWHPPRFNTRAAKSVACAARLSSEGAVSDRRCAVDSADVREIIGLGQDGDRWGLVTAERASPEALTLRALDGATAPFGEWTFSETPAICGDAVISTRLYLFGSAAERDEIPPFSIQIGPQMDGPAFAQPRLVTVERSPRGGSACLRRVWCTERLEEIDLGDGEYVDDLWAAFRLNARGGRLVGTRDDAQRIATVPVTLDQDAPPADI
ncbi:MAG: hypothetical protein U0326_24255 [Polyangiales bacterium]